MSSLSTVPQAGGAQPLDAAGPGPAAAAASPPLVVLHVLAPAPAGGLERVVELLATGHAAMGHALHVAAIFGPGDEAGELTTALGRAGVVVHALRLRSRAYLEERRAVAALCRSLRPTVVHTHGYRPDVLDAPVARALGIPVVTTVHGFTGGSGRNRAYEWLQRRGFRRMTAVVAVSEPLARALLLGGVRPERLHMIRNAWRPAADAGLEPCLARAAVAVPAQAFHIGWVGRLSAEKGADVLVEALALLPDLPLVASVVGDGRERGEIQARAEAAGLADRIRWHGLLPAAERLFPGFDVLVLSSRTEGTPMVLFEAMHARTPVVATRVGGVPDVLGDQGALLVAPEDPRALAAAIRAVYDDPAGAARRAAVAADRLASRFDYAGWLRAYEDLYRSLAKG